MLMSQLVILDLEDNSALNPAARRAVCGGYYSAGRIGFPPPSRPVPIPYPNTMLSTDAWQTGNSSPFTPVRPF
jgi:hypothetical protein